MRNIKVLKNAGFALLAGIFVLVLSVAFIAYTNRNLTNANPILQYAIRHHLWIMVALIVMAVAFGFFWSNISYSEIVRKKKDTQNILAVMMQFLSTEERLIIDLLFKQGGTSTQQEVSRLPGMNRVKAFRSLQKMQEKALVHIDAHGKVRTVTLKENILRALQDIAE